MKIDPREVKTDVNGLPYIEHQKCGTCGSIQPAVSFTRYDNNNWMSINECKKCRTDIMSIGGDPAWCYAVMKDINAM